MLRRFVSQKYDVVEGHLGMSEVQSNEVEIADLQGNNGSGVLKLCRLVDGEVESVCLFFLLAARQAEIKLDDYKRIVLRAVDRQGQPVPKARITLLCRHPTEEWPYVEIETDEDGQLAVLTFPGTFRETVQFFASVGKSPRITIPIWPMDPPERLIFLTVA